MRPSLICCTYHLQRKRALDPASFYYRYARNDISAIAHEYSLLDSTNGLEIQIIYVAKHLAL